MPNYKSCPPHKVALTLCALGIGSWYCAAAAAQSESASSTGGAETGQLETIVVTAERRTTDIQNAPLAITAVSSDALDKSFINDIAGMNGIVPSLESTKTSGFENIVTLRGVGSETPENAPTTVPGVSEFIDGVYIANTISLDQTLFDLDHIEVLRGPQGALYGQSSIGGAINIVTKQPELNVLGGAADFSVGNYELHRERGELNLPIGDTIAARFSAQRYDHEGFTNDTALPDFREDDAHDTSAKGAFLWKPTDAFSATATAQWYQAQEHGAAQKNIRDPEPSPRELFQDYPNKFDLTAQLYHLNLQYDLPWFSIKSVTAEQILNHIQQEDSSRSAFSLIGSYDDVAAWNTTVHNFNQELDLVSQPGSALDWIVGGFFLYQTTRQFVAEFEGTTANPDVSIPPDIRTAPPANLAYGNESEVLRHSYSFFAQGTYHVTPRLRLTLGARENHDAYSQVSNNFSAFSINTVHHSKSDDVPTGRGELDFDLTPESMIYVSGARGYKPGGVNGIYGQIIIPNTFEPETNTAVEIGSKNFLFDRSLRLNLAGFYYFYKNMQYIEVDPFPFDSGIANIPSVHIYGAEAEASYYGWNDRLRINANLAVEDGKVQGLYSTIDSTVTNAIENAPFPSPCAFGGAFYNPACWAAVLAAAKNIGGNTPPAMPKVSGSVNVSYAFPIPWGTLTPRAEYVYRGSEWARIFNEPGLDYVKAYGITNLNFEFVPTGSRFSVSLAATNLFDVAGVNSRYTDPFGTGQTSQQYIPPFQIIASVRYSF